ncbi:hypothetical protein ACFX19_035617 [Malus domestica]
MNYGHHMLSGEGGTTSSPRFKSKRRSEGPDIFRCVKERRGRTSQDRRNARRGFLQAEIQVCFERPAYLYKNQPSTGISEIEEASSEIKEANSKIEEVLAFSKAGLAQISERHLHFQMC